MISSGSICWLAFFGALVSQSWAAAQDGTPKSPPVAVIGAGYSGLAAALELKLLGHEVVIYEKANHVGGRAYSWSENGYTFDAGPSWYWMPHVFDDIFAKHGRRQSEFYNLTRLDPAYAVYFGENDKVLVPGDLQGLTEYILSEEPESAACIEKFMSDGKRFYEQGIGEWIWKPMVSLIEFLDISLIRAALTLNMFGSLETEIHGCVRNDRLRALLKWPVIFLGASPKEAPAMYSLMSYAGHADGTWYPDGGMSAPAEALGQMARDLGVDIQLGAPVEKLEIDGKEVKAVCTKTGGCEKVSGVVASGDYYHMEQVLLPKHLRRYDESYWDSQVLSPSALLYYVGVQRVMPLEHHTFFFDDKLDQCLHTVIDEHRMDKDPVFYVTSTTGVDSKTAPPGGSAIFILVPISYQLNGTDSPKVRKAIFENIVRRMEKDVGAFREDIAFYRDYGPKDFEEEFHAFRGNAFGHANLLSQSLILKPSMESMLDNLVFAGHLTNPGPGVPPVLASGSVAAQLLQTKLSPPVLSFQRLVVLLCIFLLVWRCSLRTELQRSTRACMRLMYNHGRTFFAGAILMKPQDFLDTAAIYGLMRIADDCVDEVDDYAERKRRLDEFEGIFWRCWNAKSACEADHEVMPAVIETCLRHGWGRDLFERFFKAMRSDTAENICRNWEDSEAYIDGSAAVVGEFMLPLLMPNATAKERDRARPYAMDLGKAFQLTNFCRDIDEDLDIQRQYVPVHLCEKHGVDLWKRTSHQAGFAAMIEEVFQRCDALYESGDKGIAILPARIRPVVLVASKLYQSIQDEVRLKHYDVFKERTRVPMKKKLKLAAKHVGCKVATRMVIGEMLLVAVFALDRISIPFCLLVTTWQFCEHFSWPGLTYAGFHCIFTLPATALMTVLARQSSPSPQYFETCSKIIGGLCVVATCWTTPWDNYLVLSGVWDYPDTGHVLGVVGYVPIEEYAFFTIETVFVGMIWVWQGQVKSIPHFRKRTPWRALGLTGLAVLFTAALWMLTVDRTFYLGLIVVWSTPILAIQWAFGADALMAQRDCWMPPLIYAWTYLCLIDRWAIKNGCWNINVETSVPRADFLPFEEAYFFLVTSLMCIWGLQLATNVLTMDCGFRIAVQRVVRWSRKVAEPPAPFRWTPPRLHLLGLSMLGKISLLFLRGLPEHSQVVLMTTSSLVGGLAFGTASMVVADWLQIRRTQLYMGYACTTLLVVFGWWACPATTFFLTTGVAMYHFALADTQGRPGSIPFIDFVARGGMLLFAGSCQPVAASWITEQLVPGSVVGAVHILPCLTTLHFACLGLSIAIHAMRCHKGHHLDLLLEQLLLTGICWCLPPLMSFMIYLNAVYAPRLLLRARRLSAARGSLSQLWQQQKGCAAMLLAKGGMGFAFISWTSSGAPSANIHGAKDSSGALLKSAVVLLSALWMPSMFVMSMRMKRSSGRDADATKKDYLYVASYSAMSSA